MDEPIGEGFCPAVVGDLAVLETATGDWVLGEVQSTSKAGRVVKLCTKHNRTIHVHTGDNVRVAKVSKMKDRSTAINAWLDGPEHFPTWQEARAYLTQYKKET